MKIKSLVILLLALAITSLTGCAAKEKVPDYKKITADEAKQMMSQNNDIIIVDVRTQEEFDSGHIENAILIPDTEISSKAESTLTDKSATILVYCRSGRRSAGAAEELSKLGYTNIYDFGGIVDWTYDIVTE
jgi:rhodanese-related sulfurtransferase